MEEERLQSIYQRLLNRDPIAPSDFIEYIFQPLLNAIQRKHSHLYEVDSHELTDCVSDALLNFCANPQRYIRGRGSLWSYLVMDVTGDVRNWLQRKQRHHQRTIDIESVEHTLFDGNQDLEEQILNQIAPDYIPDGVNATELISDLKKYFSEPREWESLYLIVTGERSTSVYASLFGISHWPINDQKQYVKRLKDKIKKRLERYGVKHI